MLRDFSLMVDLLILECTIIKEIADWFHVYFAIVGYPLIDQYMCI